MSGELQFPETLRQSNIARFDACPLSLKFDLTLDLRQIPGPIGVLGARGQLFHSFAEAALNHMRAHGEREIGVDQAMELLAEVITQRDVPDEEVAHLPMRELRWLRVLATKWSYEQRFDVDRIVAVEQRLSADLDIRGPNGTSYQRTITGKPDVLVAGPAADEATVVDWKTGWAPPAKKRAVTEPAIEERMLEAGVNYTEACAQLEAERKAKGDKLSDMGYVQQVVYGWLVMRNYPAVQRVTEREVYVMAKTDKVRTATVERWEMERIEDVLAAQVAQIDAALVAGEESKRWFPVPGTHCGTCTGVRLCPVRKRFGIPANEAEAQRLGREWHVGGEIRKERSRYVKGWVDEHGPIPIAHAKGRRVIGYSAAGSLMMYEPDDADDSPYDALLEEAARERGVLE